MPVIVCPVTFRLACVPGCDLFRIFLFSHRAKAGSRSPLCQHVPPPDHVSVAVLLFFCGGAKG